MVIDFTKKGQCFISNFACLSKSKVSIFDNCIVLNSFFPGVLWRFFREEEVKGTLVGGGGGSFY